MEDEEYEFDPWEGSSGLPNYLQVRIENPHFGYDAQIQNGQACLFKPEGTVLSGDGVDEPTEFTQFYGCGPGWEPASKGQRVVREDGKARQFNNNVAYYHLFHSLKQAAVEQGLEDQLRKRGTPFDASTWQGLVLDLEREQLPEFEGSDGKMVKRSVLKVKQIVKMGDTTPTKAKSDDDGESVKASVTSGTSSGASGANGAGELDAKTKAKIKALAREVRSNGGSHSAFVERAFDIEGVLDNPVAEEAVIADGDGSIWASVE